MFLDLGAEVLETGTGHPKVAAELTVQETVLKL